MKIQRTSIRIAVYNIVTINYFHDVIEDAAKTLITMIDVRYYTPHYQPPLYYCISDYSSIRVPPELYIRACIAVILKYCCNFVAAPMEPH